MAATRDELTFQAMIANALVVVLLFRARLHPRLRQAETILNFVYRMDTRYEPAFNGAAKGSRPFRSLLSPSEHAST